MKKLLFFSLLLVSIASFSRKVYLKKGGDNGFFTIWNSNYKPGDTLVIAQDQNNYSYAYFSGFVGSASNKYTLINEGGPITTGGGIDVEGCQYFKVTGSGSSDRYGFVIANSTGVGVNIHGKSAHCEAERFYVSNSSFGVWCKNEASCDSTITNWVLDDISFHDFEVHDVKIEGMYLGSTDANNVSRPVTCNGVITYSKPSKLGNIKVFNAVIIGTGRPAIMLSNAIVGMSEIYNNLVSNVGRELNDQQGTGISVGLYTHVYIHDNIVKNTLTWGIASLGASGFLRIEGNRVDSSGSLEGHVITWAQNIIVDTRTTVPTDSTTFSIINNQVSHPGTLANANIYVSKQFPTYGAGSIICNNTVNGSPAKVVVEPGIIYSTSCTAPPSGKVITEIITVYSDGSTTITYPANLPKLSIKKKMKVKKK